MSNPFEGSGRWVKAALHTHSTLSDGTLVPDRLVQAYAEVGFGVVAITDHWRLAKPRERDDVVLVPAAELGFDMRYPRYPRQSAEFLAYGIHDIPEDPGGDRSNWYSNAEDNYEVRTFPSLEAGCAWTAEQGGVAYVAHPYWNQLTEAELVEASGFAGIEVFNGSAETECGRGDSSPWWDSLLGDGRAVLGIATDDQHYPLFDLGRAWTMLHMTEPTVEEALSALRDGATYMSEGPLIHDVIVHPDGIEVRCSGARDVRVQTEEEWGAGVAVGHGGRRQGRVLATDDAGLITGAFVEGDPGRRYRRVVVVDAQGRRAWTNPL